MSSSQQKLLSLIVTSRDPNSLHSFLDHIQETIHDPAVIEVLIKSSVKITHPVKTYPFSIKLIKTVQENDCAGYFIGIVTDEVRFKTQKWDQVLSQYINFYDDGVFRLKLSPFKYENYYSHHDCSLTPETYPIMTRKWVELAGGINSTYPESWYQQIDYHLGQTEGLEGIRGLFRSIPPYDLLIEEVNPENKTAEEQHLLCQERWSHYRIQSQQEFRRIATQMMAYVWSKSTHLEEFKIVEDQIQKQFVVNEKLFNYYLSPDYILVENFNFLIKLFQYPIPGMIKAFMLPAVLPRTRWKRWINYSARAVIVLIAFLFSFVYVNENSMTKPFFKGIFQRKKSRCVEMIKQE